MGQVDCGKAERNRIARPNVEVTGAARLYRAASGGPQGYASDTYMPLLPF